MSDQLEGESIVKQGTEQSSESKSQKPAWESWLKGKQKFSRPEKVTGDDLEQRFASAASRVREGVSERTPEQNSRLGRRVAVSVLLLSALGLTVTYSLSTQSYEKELATNAQQLIVLESDLDAALKPADTTTVSTDIAASEKALFAAGQKVATTQQRFAQLYFDAFKQPDAGNGVPNQAALDTVEHRKQMAPLFDPKSYVVPDEQAYTWSTIADTGTAIDPRFEWFVRYDGANPSDPKTYRWELETSTPRLDSGTTATAVWVCRDVAASDSADRATGEVLAWASATFDDETKTFSRLRLVMTAYGAKHSVQSPAQTPTQTVPELDEGK